MYWNNLNRIERNIHDDIVAQMLISLDLYPLVAMYVTKYQDHSLDRKKISKLVNLLRHKGRFYTADDLRHTIQYEYYSQNYLHFCAILQYIPHYPLYDFIAYYVRRFERRYKEYVPMLACYIEENNLYDGDALYLLTLNSEVERIKKVVEAEDFERRLLYYSGGPVSLAEVDVMTGHQFVDYLRDYLMASGVRDAVVRKTRDFGGDILVTDWNSIRTALQAKRFVDHVGVEAVQQAYAAVAHYHASYGMVVTNSYFTSQARELALDTNIRLVDRDELVSWVRHFQTLKSRHQWGARY